VPNYYLLLLTVVTPSQPYRPVCMPWQPETEMNVTILYIGPRIQLGMTQPPPQCRGIESRLCGGFLDGHIFVACLTHIMQVPYENVRSSSLIVIGGAFRFDSLERGRSQYEICGVATRFSGNSFIYGFKLRSLSDLSKLNLRHIQRYLAPPRCSVDASTFVPRLLHGETTQGFWTVTYVHQYIRSRPLGESPHTALSLNHLL
jgi:hypothetical protein